MSDDWVDPASRPQCRIQSINSRYEKAFRFLNIFQLKSRSFVTLAPLVLSALFSHDCIACWALRTTAVHCCDIIRRHPAYYALYKTNPLWYNTKPSSSRYFWLLTFSSLPSGITETRLFLPIHSNYHTIPFPLLTFLFMFLPQRQISFCLTARSFSQQLLALFLRN